jgi:AmmeMemoRadiSam system protein A
MVDRITLASIASLDATALRDTIEVLMARGIRGLDTCACGEAPIMATMEAAKALGATGGKIVSYAHSGEIPIGDRERVVGYGAVVFTGGLDKAEATTETPATAAQTLSPTDKKALLAFARETIFGYLTTQTLPLPRGMSPAALQTRGVFVTLKKRGNLRGCIGRMTPDRPLANLIGAMALQAAFEDPRFAPVTLKELPDLEIEISVLTPMQPVSGPGAIVVRDGVLLKKRGRSAVFLPQVAPEQGWGRDEMLDHLGMKAGLPAGAWKEGAQFSTFQALVFGEADSK